LIGMAIVIPAARAGWFLPKGEIWDFPDRKDWEPEWTGILEIRDGVDNHGSMSMLRAWSPYLLIAVLLVASRLPALGLSDLLRAWTLEWRNIFGTSVGSGPVQLLYSPGSIFIVVSAITFYLHRMKTAAYIEALKISGNTMLKASLTLVFTVPMVQVFLNTDGGLAGFDKMPNALAEGVAVTVGSAWPIFAPFIGGFGAFVAGSNTVSNMTFALFQFGVGQRIGVDPTWIVALQSVGGAAGNVICVHNVVAASAVVGLLGKEGLVIRKTLPVFLYYATLAGFIGYMIVWSKADGWMNMGTLLTVMLMVGLAAFVRLQLKTGVTR
jgi:lactate permease